MMSEVKILRKSLKVPMEMLKIVLLFTEILMTLMDGFVNRKKCDIVF